MNKKQLTYHIIVTGASSGLGLETVRKLTQSGHLVIGLSRTIEDKSILIDKQFECNFMGLNYDLNKPIDSKKIYHSIDFFLKGQLDVIINCAGNGILGPLESLSLDQLVKQFHTNCFGSYELTKICIPYLQRSQGKIINITSMVSFTTFPFYGAYSASKSALSKLSETFYYELMPLGIQVSDIQLGAFKSQFIKNSTLNLSSSPNHIDQTENYNILNYKERELKFKIFQKTIEDFQGMNINKITKRMLKLVNAKKTKPIYIWGVDANLNYLLRKVLPANLFIKIQHLLYTKWIF